MATNTNVFSKPLTKAQAEYAKSRLMAILAIRLEAAVATLTAPEKVKEMTNEEKYALIASGKAKILPFEDLSYSAYWKNAFIFPAHDAKLAAFKVAQGKYAAACDKAQRPIQAAYRMAMDTMMLGDATAAMQVIEDFASSK